MRLKWTTAEEKEWWYTKHSAVRRAKLVRVSEAQNHRCCYCGTPTWSQTMHEPRNGRPKGMGKWQMATLEHVKAQVHGGTDSLWNLTMSCSGCNSARGSLFEAEEFYELMQDGDTYKERHRILVRAREQRKQKRAAERQVNQAVFMLRMAWLFLQAPEFGDLLVQAVEEDRRRYLEQRELHLAAQQAEQARAA